MQSGRIETTGSGFRGGFAARYSTTEYSNLPIFQQNGGITMDHLDNLESQSIYILREAYKKFKKLAMLWSIGKDSTVLLWLARKAFFGHCPIPLAHIDTSFKIPEMIAFRDRVAREWDLKLIVGTNEAALAEGMGPEKGRLVCCAALEQKFWEAFTGAIGLAPGFIDDRRNPAATKIAVATIIAGRSADEWRPLFAAADCCVTIMATLEEALRDPHFAGRGLFAHKVAGPTGATMPALPVPIDPQFRDDARTIKIARKLGGDKL